MYHNVCVSKVTREPIEFTIALIIYCCLASFRLFLSIRSVQPLGIYIYKSAVI